MEISKIEELSKIYIEEGLGEDIEAILKWVEVLENVPNVEPLYTPIEEFSALREDEVENWEFVDCLKDIPEKRGKFIKFISPIGRKT